VAASATTHEHVQRTLDQIHQNYSQRLTLTTLAKRLERQSAGVKIEAVALDLGYRSRNNFHRQFARHFGVTPEAFRKKQKLGCR
jgi:AraC-like DNA-binding protein